MAGEEESITNQAYQEFAQDSTFATLNQQPLGPVYIRNLSLKKDPSYCGESSLRTAPNFASALLGNAIASKLRLDNSPSSTDINSGSGSTTSSYVFKDVNAVIKPGEGTLLLVSAAYGISLLQDLSICILYIMHMMCIIILTLPSLQSLHTGTIFIG